MTQTNAYNSNYAGQAGEIADSESSSLEINRYTEAGNISFWYTIDSELSADFLSFYIDGVLVDEWSGYLEYSQAVYPLTTGMHHFRREYTKNSSNLDGEDTAWIDTITFPGSVDSDGDGMPDGWEIDNDMDALTNDAGDDADGDLFTNGMECLLGTDPHNSSDYSVMSRGFEADLDVDGMDLYRLAGGLVSGIVTPAEVPEFAEAYGR